MKRSPAAEIHGGRAQEVRDKRRRTKFSVDELAARTDRWATHFQMGVTLFDGADGYAVQAEVILIGSAPHGRAVFRLIPDFPVTDVVAKPFRPALIVMPYDAQADISPFGGIGRRMSKSFLRGVFDAFARQTIGAGLSGGGEILSVSAKS